MFRKWLPRALACAAVVWLSVLTFCAARPPAEKARGLSSGGGMVMGNGGGIRKVEINSAGILAGSGTVANPLTVTVTNGSGLSGTGSSGDPLVAGAGSGMTSNAGSLSVNAGSGLTSDATNVRANLGTDLSFVSGAISQARDYAGTHFAWTEDFVRGGSFSLTASSMMFGEIWNVTNATAGLLDLSTTGDGTTTRPGIGQMRVSTVAGRTALITNPQLIDFASGSWTFEAVVGWPVLSDTGSPTEAYSTLIGFSDLSGAAGVDVVDGCYFLYDTQNVATSGPNTGKVQKLSCWCASNSTRTASVFLMDGSTVSSESFTTVDAPVAALTLPNTNIYHLKIVMTGTTRAEFFVNGVKSCNITPNIPSGSARLTGATIHHIKGTGNTARNVDVDWTRIAVDLNAARSP